MLWLFSGEWKKEGDERRMERLKCCYDPAGADTQFYDKRNIMMRVQGGGTHQRAPGLTLYWRARHITSVLLVNKDNGHWETWEEESLLIIHFNTFYSLIMNPCNPWQPSPPTGKQNKTKTKTLKKNPTTSMFGSFNICVSEGKSEEFNTLFPQLFRILFSLLILQPTWSDSDDVHF